MKNGDEEELAGWITMRSDEGEDFVKKVGLEQASALSESESESEEFAESIFG